jgi:hypothetical protein
MLLPGEYEVRREQFLLGEGHAHEREEQRVFDEILAVVVADEISHMREHFPFD